MELREYEPRDYRQLMFNVMDVPENRSILQTYKKLSAFPEFKAHLPDDLKRDQVLTYVVLMYDKNSPLRLDIDNVEKRKINAVHISGFEINDDLTYPDNVEKMMLCELPAVAEMIIAYVRMHLSATYSFLVATEEVYYRGIRGMMTGETFKFKEMTSIKNEMAKAQDELLAEDNTKSLRDTLLRYTMREKLELRPEDIAQRLQDGLPPIAD